MVDLKTRFYRTYANLPLPIRNQIAVVVIDSDLKKIILAKVESYHDFKNQVVIGNLDAGL